MAKRARSKPTVLLILDGWGVGSLDSSNAIHLAKTPHFDGYVAKYPYTTLHASSVSVGLPAGQDGNSEAGHMNIGAGRVVEQDSVTISRAISDGTFFKNPAFLQAVKHARKYDAPVHLIGLLSDGQSAHSHPDHLIALITFFKYQKVKHVYLHLFTDGRDGPRYGAIKLLRKYQTFFNTQATIASIIGRVYAMDRKKDWKHTELAYNAMVLGKAAHTSSSAEDAVLHAYNRGETDEFIQPTVVTAGKRPIGTIGDGDSVVFFNLRSDRARQLAKPFVQSDFESENSGAFTRGKALKKLFFVAMTDFGPDLDLLTAFPSRDIVDTLPAVLCDRCQLYIAESEKYAHMTYFFNGGYDAPIAGENRMLVNSPDALSYRLTPRMGLPAITTKVVAALKSGSYDFIAANISNADMLAHTGDIRATVGAVEYVDGCLKRIVDAALAAGGTVVITGDHGNAEELVNRHSGEIDTEHSKSLVPFIIVRQGVRMQLRKRGSLADVAPTILQLMGVPKPELMTGNSLIVK